jgi:hypothetical protein
VGKQGPRVGDSGKGARAVELLALEPRLLRWFLGLKEDAPWPSASTKSMTGWRRKLLAAANSFGGEASLRGRPCRCATCINRQLILFDDEHFAVDSAVVPCSEPTCDDGWDSASSEDEFE